MKEIPIKQYFRIGYNFSLLQHSVHTNRSAHGENSITFALSDFFDQLEAIHLDVTSVLANDLRACLKELEELDSKATIEESLSERIKEQCSKIRPTLTAELTLRQAYIVTSKRFDLSHLTASPEKLFAANVFPALPKLSRYDISEACKCIAYERSTSAAFHLMRGLEGVLKHYYLTIVKRNRLSKPMWHGMVKQLRERRDSPPTALLDHLDNIRTNFRNPTQHPDARYDLDEVQDLLAVTIDITNRIIRDLKKRKS